MCGLCWSPAYEEASRCQREAVSVLPVPAGCKNTAIWSHMMETDLCMVVMRVRTGGIGGVSFQVTRRGSGEAFSVWYFCGLQENCDVCEVSVACVVNSCAWSLAHLQVAADLSKLLAHALQLLL
jgi:hypothetical protein